MTPRERFAKDHDLTMDQVNKLVTLANRYHNAEVRCASGSELDYHDSAERVERTGNRFTEEAKRLGFTGVVFPGFWPVLVKNGDQYELPSD